VFHVASVDHRHWCPGGRVGPSHDHRRVEEALATAGGVGRSTAARCCCGRGGGKSSGWPGRDGHHVGVEEAGVSHLSNMGSGSEASGSDASAGNGAAAGGARIRVDGAEQPWASEC
jgi:hypothetical protein